MVECTDSLRTGRRVDQVAGDTLRQYDEVLARARAVFAAKNRDYGDSWRLLRVKSITDQIWVKVRRIRQLEEMPDAPQVPEGVETEYLDILNYCVMALIKLAEGGDDIESVERLLSQQLLGERSAEVDNDSVDR
jgi:hypothetical protein